MKKFTADENGYNGPASLFISAMTAGQWNNININNILLPLPPPLSLLLSLSPGVPAAYLCTPADVIKTRLQVIYPPHCNIDTIFIVSCDELLSFY